MDIESFRACAHAAVDRMADYLRDIEHFAVRARTQPGEIGSMLEPLPPDEPHAMERIMDDLERIVIPGLTHWQHPRFFAYFPANSSPPSIIAEMFTATFAAQCMLWQTSPAATEMETRVLDWLRAMIGLAEGFTGVIQDSASGATLCAILVGREKATAGAANERGLAACPPLAVYTSSEAHSSIEKGVKIAGLGREAIRIVPADASGAMIPADLAAMIGRHRAAGVTPACIIASLGTTNRGAMDPIEAIAAIAGEENVYFHVDAAWAGSALILPEVRAEIGRGLGAADSVCFNPHKWLMTNFDCAAHFVKDPALLTGALSIMRSYYKGPAEGRVIDYRDWSIPLGRRFRALKLWFVIRAYGVAGLQAIVRGHIDLARRLEALIEAEPEFEIASPRSLSLLLFRFRPQGVSEAQTDRLNERLVAAVNDDGRTYLTPGHVGGRPVIRLAIGQTTTEWRHVEEAFDAVREIAQALRPEDRA